MLRHSQARLFFFLSVMLSQTNRRLDIFSRLLHRCYRYVYFFAKTKKNSKQTSIFPRISGCHASKAIVCDELVQLEPVPACIGYKTLLNKLAVHYRQNIFQSNFTLIPVSNFEPLVFFFSQITETKQWKAN